MPSLKAAFLAAATSVAAYDYSQLAASKDNYGAPNPNTTYPGFESDSPAVIAGSDSYQVSPPKYPSPWADPSYGNWSHAYEKAYAFVSQLTLAEKVNLTTGTGWQLEACVGNTGGIPRLGFRGLCLQDSPVGIRMTDYNSVFPAGVNVAATWDRKIAYDRGRAIGKEHHGKGIDVHLGPVAGPLGRVPEGGRNWEGFSPDPVLTGQLFAESIKGVQSAGVVATGKHYIMNEQDHFRLVPDSTAFGFNISEPFSANLDDETLHELYLWPFADGVKAGVGSIMCSYNQVNDSQACQNSYVLNYLLKGELGFQGFVMSDWLGTHSGVDSILAGLDMTMPGEAKSYHSLDSFYGTNLTVAVLNGTVPAWRIDDAALRIVSALLYVGGEIEREPENFQSWTTDTYGPLHYFPGEGGIQLINQHFNVQGDHGKLIRQWGAESTVLLKNVNGTLPLTGKEPLTAVFGNDAGPNLAGPNSCSDRGCDNGTLGMAWGSGSAEFPYLITPDTALQNEVVSNGGAYESILNNWDLEPVGALARRANVSIVFANSNSGEWYLEVDGNLGDRNNLTFWQGADEAIERVAGNCSNTVLVIHSTGPVLLEKYKNHENITAILWAGVPGQETGNAIADVLYGRVNPGAKLPFTVGKKREDYGADVLYTPNAPVPQINFKEGVFIDYRAFDKFNETPTYEFGYGLSYTTFNYTDVKVTKLNATAYKPFSGKTKPAPTIGNFSTKAEDYLFPLNFTRVSAFHYPWLNSTNFTLATADPDYGLNVSLPEHAQDGSAQVIPKAGGAPGGNPRLYDIVYKVEATVTNTGDVAGYEVPQLYISRGGPYDPVRELRGFERIWIEAGESETFTVEITRRDISSWSTVEQDWFVRNSTKKVWVGSSSRELPLSATLP
ncbi:Putative glycoside hydrolase, family 3, glycoside hydrolase family 3 domain, immunoglobulin [Septoria linicola]|uniref:beta-glucosidase n=1 Tax=Septoria linicola TaxID=215465 RepID=A0A9Q9AVE9_9PEZI|nr:putative glycoside hydrolase, family 3, glycoside hydrolase family 3 domain, immunoglobulin [Septoria linicola]USW53260.1 Putative glycoside hydrolase, family 3, glycoside hydrolase family 3 domain, immunoglobulin [Septoria linicola]